MLEDRRFRNMLNVCLLAFLIVPRYEEKKKYEHINSVVQG